MMRIPPQQQLNEDEVLLDVRVVVQKLAIRTQFGLSLLLFYYVLVVSFHHRFLFRLLCRRKLFLVLSIESS